MMLPNKENTVAIAERALPRSLAMHSCTENAKQGETHHKVYNQGRQSITSQLLAMTTMH